MRFEMIESTKLREKILFGTHESGLKIYIVPKKGFSKYYAIYGTEYGSIDTKLKVPGSDEVINLPDGIAHFLEHKLFEEEDGQNAFDKFALTGANANAFTSFDMTAYLFSCTEDFYENLDILLEFVNHPYFTKENVDKEQGIIGQEIKMYEDDPSWRLFFNMLQGMYFNNPVKTDIAGTVESISRITPELLFKCTDAFYNPSNMFLVLVGDISEEKIVQCVNKAVSADRDRGRINREVVDEPKEVVKTKVVQKMSVSKPLFLIGFKEKTVDIEGRKLLKKTVETQILTEILFGKSSDFFMKLYSEGLIDSSFGKDCEFEKKYGFSSITGESKDPDVVYERVMGYLENVKASGLSEEDIVRGKRVLLGKNLRIYNSVENIGNDFIRCFMNGINPFEYGDAVNSVTADDLMRRLNDHFDKNSAVLSVIEPLEEK